MKVYKCIITGDELCSDSYEPLLPPLEDESLADVAFEIKSKKIVSGNEDYGIADNSEEGEGGMGSSAETVVDVIHAFNLTETSFSKKDFGVYVKGYMVKLVNYLKEHKPDRVDKFKEEIQVLVKKILGNFSEFQFYLGESNEIEGTVVLGYYKGEEPSPRFLYFKDGLREEKY